MLRCAGGAAARPMGTPLRTGGRRRQRLHARTRTWKEPPRTRAPGGPSLGRADWPAPTAVPVEKGRERWRRTTTAATAAVAAVAAVDTVTAETATATAPVAGGEREIPNKKPRDRGGVERGKGGGHVSNESWAKMRGWEEWVGVLLPRPCFPSLLSVLSQYTQPNQSMGGRGRERRGERKPFDGQCQVPASSTRGYSLRPPLTSPPSPRPPDERETAP